VERAGPEPESTARRARRLVWAFRLIFYPCAALIALAALAGRSDGVTPETFRGATDAGRPVTLYFAYGQPEAFSTSVGVTCPRSTYVQPVYAREPDTTLLLRDGRLTAEHQWAHRYGNSWVGLGTTTLTARVDGDSATGTVQAVQRLSGPTRSYECDSGVVSFSARAS
jgi:hypothetical protein